MKKESIPKEALLSIIENSYDGIFITDGDANTILINRAYESITGLSRAEVLGRNMRELVKDKAISSSGSLMVLQTGGPVTLHQEFKTGKKALITSSPVFDERGKINMVVTNVRDLTEIYSLKSQIEKSAKERRRLSRELELIKNDFLSHDLIAESPITLSVLRLADKVSELDTLVILLGETGVGKEVFAKYIHTKSPRKGKPFVRVNCGAIPENLIESELFGYEKGAFTGASRSGKAGLFEVADGGTIFLDEIGELPLSMQVRLLRVLQDQEIQRIGSLKTIRINVRIIAATNRTLEDMVREGLFREDLYYRLMVFPITIPPLRQRTGDIVPLTRYFTNSFNKKYGFQKQFSEECFPVMEEYLWPGNIRELRNVVEHALIISNDETIRPEDLIVFQKRNANRDPVLKKDISDLPAYIARLEKQYAEAAYEKYGNVREAAKSLGISPATFVRKRHGTSTGKH